MGLKELWVCRVGPEWEYLRRIVQDLERPCLTGIEQQVATDLEGLRDTFPGWRTPVVKVLEDREELMKEFAR